jgi:putative endonuclease
MAAEQLACDALIRDGFTIVGRRMRTAAGEIDAVAERDGLTVFVEVKGRKDLASAAFALQPRQQARLMDAAEILLGENPTWGKQGVRFDFFFILKNFFVFFSKKKSFLSSLNSRRTS